MKQNKSRIKKLIKIELALMLIVIPATLFALFKEYQTIPGTLKAHDIKINKRADTSIEVSWPEARNTDTYTLSYKEQSAEKWTEKKIPGRETSAVIRGLKEGTPYEVTITANSKEKAGTSKARTTAETKKRQEITGKPKQQKLAGRGSLDLDSETELNFSSDDESVAKVDDEHIEFRPGTTVITAEAQESEDYTKETAEVEVEVLNSISENSDSADMHIISVITPSDCERIYTITDDVPQSFARNGNEYIVAFGGSNVIKYRDEKNYYDTDDLGHANGFTYSEDTGMYYSVRGRSALCVTCDLDNDEYGAINLPYGASGIAYDSTRNMFYTSSVTKIVSYNKDFTVDKVIAAIKHDGTYYAQDCGAHAGIMMHCVSGEPRHGINYVDLYDMVNGKYLGTLECDLSEVESATVDKDGYMLLLCNNSGNEDYIYKTQINIKDLGSDLTPGLQ